MDFKALSEGLGLWFSQLWQTSMAFVPRLLVAALVVVLGWVIARVFRLALGRLISRLAGMASSQAVGREWRASGIEGPATRAIGGVVYWAVFLFFVAAAIEILGLQVVTAGLGRLVQYFPSIVAAILVVLAGVVIGNVSRSALARAATGAGVTHAEVLAQAARVTILLVAGVIALDQIGIESTVLIIVLAVLVGTVLGGAALAFGLGAREAVQGAIAVHYVEQSYQKGDRVRLGGVQGRILEFTRTGVVIATDEGRALIPAAEFARNTSMLLAD